ncbi:MAG: endopeptidase La [Candidatus Rokubacteria bacterium 13_1_40CM_69_27]|nr:MAG: endopeptidase La [Candidatus Rokubacteria bacterium 13_1_40CM_69_27]OLC30514.1 MAG: endopeptidase La [Candidatus Rokubacteria bacterium 13_1_40CM_4_69_5]OLE36621.1 MAG: endopeptidase La [Candidatus Rokubacteria bacterium 13_1_20CM_2_70_7]
MTNQTEGKDLPVPDILAILPLRSAIVFPHAVVPLAAGRSSSVRLIDDAVQGGRLVATVVQRDPTDDEPGREGLHAVGTLTMIHRVLKQPDGTLRLVVQGLGRLRIVEVLETSPFLRARVEVLADEEPAAHDLEAEALTRSITSLFRKIVSLSPTLPDELANVTATAEGGGALADVVAASLPTLQLALKQELLETTSVKARLQKLVTALGKEAEVLELGSKIQSEIQSEMSKTQREYYLREQLKAIQKELGEGDERTQEIDALREKIEAAGMPEESRQEALRELDRLAKMPPAAAEYTVARTYIDWLVSMPWRQQTTDSVDIEQARTILDEDHEGLEKVKERILEYLAVKKIRREGKDPILCLVGPPGVGKTSLGRSVARALGRKFHRISLGGMRDEAEIRGHRRTYIGALPGQIIQGLRRTGTKNPVFMLDEIDKLGADFRGDPASALLEVLDPEQNVTFRDHYLDVPFDLSRVLFITTANVIDAVPAPLRDRMEVLHLAGYTEEEKIRIAQTHLVPKQAHEHGLTVGTDLEFMLEALRLLARGYTREAGVRNLEREIASVCRKVARQRATGPSGLVRVTPDVVTSFLGVPRFEFEELEERTRVPGVAVGLAWTPAGGDLLFIEATRMKGARTLTLTGQLGDVMKESAQAALSWVRSHAGALGLPADFWESSDVHIHVPAGAIPKDGPSAGVTLTVALVSLLTGRRVRPGLAMTGEVSLSGRALPVGGIKEKVLAAHRAGVRTVILPRRNEKNLLEDVPREVQEVMTFHLVDAVDEAVDLALEEPARRRPEPVACGV